MVAPTLAKPGKVASTTPAPGSSSSTATATIPFTRASKQKSQLAFDVTVPMGQVPAIIQPQQVPPAGYVRWVELDFTITSSGNTAAVAFAGDGPWNVLQSIALNASNGAPIIAPITGFDLFLLNKYGVLGEEPPFCNPQADQTSFTAVAGNVANGGSATFTLRVPLEHDPRDAFGAFLNTAANATLQMLLTPAVLTSVFATPPNGAVTLRVQATNHFWSVPPETLPGGAVAQEVSPYGGRSVISVRKTTVNVGAGIRKFQVTSVGSVLKMIIFVVRTATLVRTEADLPQTWETLLNNDVLTIETYRQNRAETATAYGYTGVLETSTGLNAGVVVWDDPVIQAGKAALCSRDQWLPTSDSTLLEVRATAFGANAAFVDIITIEALPIDAPALYSPIVS